MLAQTFFPEQIIQAYSEYFITKVASTEEWFKKQEQTGYLKYIIYFAKKNVYEVLKRVVISLVTRASTWANVFEKTDLIIIKKGFSCVVKAKIWLTVIGGVVYVGWSAWCIVFPWWREEISGKRCFKTAIDEFLELLGSFGGNLGGYALLAILLPGYPLVWLVGAFVCGVCAAVLAQFLTKRMTSYYFDLPEDVVVENAYTAFGLDYHAQLETVTDVRVQKVKDLNAILNEENKETINEKIQHLEDQYKVILKYIEKNETKTNSFF